MAEIEKLRYSRKEIEEAGEKIRNGLYVSEKPSMFGRLLAGENEESKKIREIVNNWRAAHNFTMELTYRGLLMTAGIVNPKALIAARLKRFSTIINKLKREKLKTRFSLTTMQDIGGCRVVLDTVNEVNEFIESI